MKYWQKRRNYRARKNADGIETFTITVNGQAIEVSREVYQAYSQADRKERYQAERDYGLLLSLDWLPADELRRVYFNTLNGESAEDVAITALLLRMICPAIELLDEDERMLITQLFFENIPLREIARQKDVYPQAIAYRRDRIMEKLKKYIGF